MTTHTHGGGSRRLLAAATVASSVLLLTGCLTVEREPHSLAADLSYLEVGDGQHPTLIQSTDYLRVAELLDDRFPGPEADEEEFFDWIVEADMNPDADIQLGALFPRTFGFSASWSLGDVQRENLGVSFQYAEQFTEAVRQVGPESQVMHGPYDTESIAEVYEGSASDGLWEADTTGNYGIDIAEIDDRLLLGNSRTDVEAVLSGDAETLADDPHALAVAEALDEESWYTVMMLAPVERAYEEERGEDPDALVPFVWMGASLDLEDPDGDPRMVARFVYQHEDAESAEQNAEIAERLFTQEDQVSELLDLEEVEVHGEMVLVTAEIPDRNGRDVWQLQYVDEPNPFNPYIYR